MVKMLRNLASYKVSTVCFNVEPCIIEEMLREIFSQNERESAMMKIIYSLSRQNFQSALVD